MININFTLEKFNHMKQILLAFLSIFLLISCKQNEEKPVEDRTELIPEGDKDLRLAQENETENTICSFEYPDSTCAGFILRKANSISNILGEKTSLEGGKEHFFLSSDKKQLLQLIVHPGDINNQVSMFRLNYIDQSNKNSKVLKLKDFETEKGIKLGINKSLLISKLGDCYVSSDSTANSITISYYLETPNDSKSGLLKNNNLPLYSAIYEFKEDRLISFEFGFENP